MGVVVFRQTPPINLLCNWRKFFDRFHFKNERFDSEQIKEIALRLRMKGRAFLVTTNNRRRSEHDEKESVQSFERRVDWACTVHEDEAETKRNR